MLEILISISIAGILFGVLFSKIREFASLRKQVKQVEAECLERQTCQIRLQELFGALVLPEEAEEKQPSLYTKQKNLFFQIEQTIDADPAFVGKLDCIVQFDAASGYLYLTMKNSSGQERKEILGKEILSYTMRFFSTKEKTWLTDWPQMDSALPAFISILCKKTFGDVDYLFALAVPTSAFIKL